MIQGVFIVIKNSTALHELQKWESGMALLLRSWSAKGPEGQFVHEVAPKQTLYSICTWAAQGGRMLVEAGEGGEYRHLQTQCRADKPIPTVIGGGGSDGPEP